jgi:hypothetical protein
MCSLQPGSEPCALLLVSGFGVWGSGGLGLPKVLKCPTGASGTPSNWSTWWIMDGGDDADSLRAVDVKAQLNQMVQHLVDEGIPLGRGEIPPVRPVLTGDGKAMLASNFSQGQTGGPESSRAGSPGTSSAGCAMGLRPSGETSCRRCLTFLPMPCCTGTKGHAPSP